MIDIFTVDPANLSPRAPIDIQITQGCDWTKTYIWQCLNTLRDFTGCTGEILICPGDDAQPFISTTTNPMGSLVLGTVGASTAGQITPAIKRTGTFELRIGRNPYGLFVTWPSGARTPVMVGTIFVLRGDPYH